MLKCKAILILKLRNRAICQKDVDMIITEKVEMIDEMIEGMIEEKIVDEMIEEMIEIKD